MQATSNDVPAFVEQIEELEFAEFTGMADDKSRFGIKCDSVGRVATEIALKNGYTVETVRQNGLGEKKYELQVTFARLGTQ